MDLTEIAAAPRNRHPWELARAACLLAMSEHWKVETAADIGAGDGYFARQVLRRRPVRMLAVDIRHERVGEGGGIHLFKHLSDVGDGSLDLAFLMDVLEHTPDDRGLLEETCRKLKPGGHIVITVPAFPFLFCAHDISLGHYRRYRRVQLQGLSGGLGVVPVEAFHFFASLFLLRCVQVLLAKIGSQAFGSGIAAWPFARSHPVTRFAVAALKADFALTRRLASRGIHLPGLSICLILRKRSV